LKVFCILLKRFRKLAKNDYELHLSVCSHETTRLPLHEFS